MLDAKVSKNVLEPCFGVYARCLRFNAYNRNVFDGAFVPTQIPVVQGCAADAEPHYRRALDIRQKVLGPDHLDVASSLNNLALYFKRQASNPATKRIA